MSKILLIEDRLERQKTFENRTKIYLKEYGDILDNQTGLNKNNLNNYSVIITHRSAFGNEDSNILDFLKHHCEETNTQLVFFSGGISSTFYSNDKFEFLLLNSNSFYSENLKLFLESVKDDGKVNLLLLGYGQNWKINILLNVLEKINIFISNNETKDEVKSTMFKSKTNVDTLSNLISIQYPSINRGKVNMKDLKEFALDIADSIKKQVALND